MNGISKITQEREDQIQKHGFDIENDLNYDNELLQAVIATINCDKSNFPPAWIATGYAERILGKLDIDRLAVAGALIAAEIDRRCAVMSGSDDPITNPPLINPTTDPE